MPHILQELKRRRVIRVAVVYLTAGLGVIYAADAYLKAYSYANLGNLQRLRGQLGESEKSYNAAIEEWSRVRGLHPVDAGPDVYVDGLAERARLFVQAGDRVEDALADHRRALTAAQSPQHRFKVARMFLIACDQAGPGEYRLRWRHRATAATRSRDRGLFPT